MEIGNLLLMFSSLAAVLSALMFLITLRNGKLGNAVIAENLLYTSTSACLAALLLLVYYFITDNFSIWYVYVNSNVEMPAIYKLSAVWAGKEGSLLLWTFLNLLVTSLFLSAGKKDWTKVKAALTMTAFTSYLLFILTFFSNPFVVLPYNPNNGYGLNPLLRTVEMVIHPPIVFLAYSLSALLFSVILSGSEQAGSEQEQIARLSWLSLTLGIIIGGWWAYRTLGWGGFWGWDPVENSSLLPWLTLTLYFHLRKHREIFAYLTFTSVLFATFVTRGGVISSVHSFGSEYTDYTYLIPLLCSLIPVLVRAKEFGDIKSVCTSQLPVLFSSALIVVFLGTVANLIVNVERSYYLITFLPVFAIIAALVILKIKKMNSVIKIIHLGVIILFLGSASVWLFEHHETLNLGTADGFRLEDILINEDSEKFTVISEIQTPYGIVYPKYLIYKIERRDRGISTVELISYPWVDHYFALTNFDLNKKEVVLEHYTIPLISAVWIGSVLMVAGGILRFSASSIHRTNDS